MGLFNFDLLQGTELSADAPRRKGVFLFSELFFRKFFKLVRLNLLYFLVSLPIAALLYLFLPVDFIVENIFEGVTPMFSMVLSFAVCLFYLTFFGTGPASAGYAYITRNITREHPTWVWSDFWDAFKTNIKQGLVVMLFDLLIVPLLMLAGFVYFQLASSGQTSYMLLMYLLMMLLVLLITMHAFIYQIMVTYECSLKMLFKNSFLLAIAKFPITALISLISAAVIFFISKALDPRFVFILFGVLFYGIVRFPLEFYAARTIERLIAANEPETHDDAEEEANDDYENSEEDERWKKYI